jgi:hypothetical protein
MTSVMGPTAAAAGSSLVLGELQAAPDAAKNSKTASRAGVLAL